VRRSAATPPPDCSTALPGQKIPAPMEKLHKKKRVAKKNLNRYDYTLRQTLEYFLAASI
jgi:hypothetical protein